MKTYPAVKETSLQTGPCCLPRAGGKQLPGEQQENKALAMLFVTQFYSTGEGFDTVGNEVLHTHGKYLA